MPACDYCKRPVRGQYWQYQNGKTICCSCRKALPKCAACGIAVQRGVSQNGEVYCPACSKKLKKCHFCNGLLAGKYWRMAERDVCRSCAESLPRCARCDTPVKEYLLIQGKRKLCVPCSNQVDHCAVCQVPLLRRYHKFPGDSRKFCSRCTNDRDRCDMCSFPLTASYHRLADGRTACEKCMCQAVRTTAHAQQVLAEALAYLRPRLKMRTRQSTRLRMVDSKTLSAVRRGVRSPGKTDRRALGIFVRKGELFEVYIESFLPHPLCLGVLAHEYTHAWQADHFPPNAGILWIEGLAEWTAYRTLLHYGHRKQAALILKQRDVYGQGFRKIQAIEHKHGNERVIAEVLKKMKV